MLHALIMKNYGCTHALIGRDHAGIGSYYDKYASHSIFDQFTPDELGIEVRLFHEVFYCVRCASHATTETAPTNERYRLNISGTGIREMLRHGLVPPKEVVRPESALAAMQGIQPKGLGDDGEGTLPVAKVIQACSPSTPASPAWAAHRASSRWTRRPSPCATWNWPATRRALHTGDVYDGVYREYTALLEPQPQPATGLGGRRA